MDIILSNHSPALLEQTFNSVYLYDHPLFSLMAERTELPWLLVIPKQPLTTRQYVESLYGDIYGMIEVLQNAGFGPHFNIAKIGNKNPNQHIHVIFREPGDEVWPDAVWCHEPLLTSDDMPMRLKAALRDFFEDKTALT
jgi:diadenosine tetraphosphate (Ap4A) HIT family hydrolase